MIRRIRPTPRPTKQVITNRSRSGFDVIAPTKEPIHEIAEVTSVVTFPTIVETVTAVVVCTHHSLFYINDRLEKTYHHKQHCKAYEVAHRLGHEKVRQLREEP